MCEDKQAKELSQEQLEALAQVQSMISGFNEIQLELTKRFVEFLLETRKHQPETSSGMGKW